MLEVESTVAVWILVADKCRARLFAGRRNQLEEIGDFAHPQSRLKRRELVTDESGRHAESATPHRSAYDPPSDPKVHEAEVFVRELCAALEAGRARNAFDKLYVVAPPWLLGAMRRQYSAPLRALVVEELDKTLTRSSTREIRQQLPRYL